MNDEMEKELLSELSKEELEEIKRNKDSWDVLVEEFEQNGTDNFILYDSVEDFGASDPDNDNRSKDDSDEDWGEYLYDAKLYDGIFVYHFYSTGRYLEIAKNI